jgi:hypothetical protein
MLLLKYYTTGVENEKISRHISNLIYYCPMHEDYELKDASCQSKIIVKAICNLHEGASYWAMLVHMKIADRNSLTCLERGVLARQ